MSITSKERVERQKRKIYKDPEELFQVFEYRIDKEEITRALLDFSLQPFDKNTAPTLHNTMQKALQTAVQKAAERGARQIQDRAYLHSKT